ncbi:FAD synthetase family protein [Lacticaseibacillus porcinae]|uniref:FAD synthetase family protein n=1 Tax=Lacticaseibacillus porcinae TaxID=1123687 RepID=UPI000F775118|nr:FAD synthetase family protein [Lacticaseibacillus porcinae]
MVTVMIDLNNIHQITTQPCVLALGFFDGVHRGHQHVIKTAKRIAQQRGLPLAVMTFDRHASTLFSDQPFDYLTTLDQKAALMADLGVQTLYVARFTREFAALTPQAFVSQFLVTLQAQVVVCGFDYTFGQFGAAGVESLETLGQGHFETRVVAALQADREKISSTRIRQLRQAGRIEEAERLLGHPLNFHQQIVAG